MQNTPPPTGFGMHLNSKDDSLLMIARNRERTTKILSMRHEAVKFRKNFDKPETKMMEWKRRQPSTRLEEQNGGKHQAQY